MIDAELMGGPADGTRLLLPHVPEGLTVHTGGEHTAPYLASRYTLASELHGVVRYSYAGSCWVAPD